jgi:hypothetical protein
VDRDVKIGIIHDYGVCPDTRLDGGSYMFWHIHLESWTNNELD